MNDSLQLITYLRDAVKDPEVIQMLRAPTSMPRQYADMVDRLETRYYQKRLIHHTCIMALVNGPHIKNNSHQEYTHLADNVRNNLSILEETGQPDVMAIWTSIIIKQTNRKAQEEWIKYSKTTKGVPDIDKLQAFLDEQVEITRSSAPS